MFINVHVLSRVSHGNINSGELGEIKSVFYSGSRSYISGWSLKNAIRMNLQKRDPIHFGGVRSADVTDIFAKDLTKEDAQYINDKLTKNGKTQIYLSPSEVTNIVATWQKEQKISLTPCLQNGHDIALFGRFCPSNADFSVERTLSCSTPISIHYANIDEQFFTLNDDIERTLLLSHKQYTYALYFWHAVLDINLLFQHLNFLSINEWEQLIHDCVYALYYSIPNANASSMYAHDLPRYFRLELTEGLPRYSLCTAFHAPMPDTREEDAIAYFDTYVQKNSANDRWIRSLYSGCVVNIGTKRQSIQELVGETWKNIAVLL